MELVSVCNVDNEIAAQNLQDLLDQSGIPVMVKRNIVPGFDIAMPSTLTTGWGEIFVRPEDLEKAKELVAAFRGGLGELAELEPEQEDGPG